MSVKVWHFFLQLPLITHLSKNQEGYCIGSSQLSNPDTITSPSSSVIRDSYIKTSQSPALTRLHPNVVNNKLYRLTECCLPASFTLSSISTAEPLQIVFHLADPHIHAQLMWRYNWPAVCLSASFLIKVCCAFPGLIALWGTPACDWAVPRSLLQKEQLQFCWFVSWSLGPLKPIWVILSNLTHTLMSASFLFFIPGKKICFLPRYVVSFAKPRLATSLRTRDLWASEWNFCQCVTQTAAF